MKSNCREVTLNAMPSQDGTTVSPTPPQRRILIVEDDFASRRLLQKLLGRVGECHIAVDGKEGVMAFAEAVNNGTPYDLVCLDIMMPKLDGQEVLQELRQLESQRGVLSTQGAKIVMITALADMKNVMSAYNSLCDGYLAKPLTRAGLDKTLAELGILEPGPA